MRKTAAFWVAALVVGSVVFSSQAYAERWRLQVYEPESAKTTILLKELAANVRERTNGELDIDLFQPGTLGYSGWGVHRVVSEKQLEMAVGITAAMTEVPAYGIFDQPIFSDLAEAKVAWDMIKPDLDKAAQEKMGLKLLIGFAKPMGYWASSKPMATVEDIKGMKIRAWNLALSKWTERMGGIPHSIPYAEVYTSLASGVVEANPMSPVSVIETKLYEVTDYFNMWPSGFVIFAAFANLEKFEALPEETRNILIEEAEKAEEENWKYQATAAAPAIEKMKELGMEIIEPSAEGLAKASAVDKSIYEEWLQEAPADVKEMAQRVLSELDK